MPRRSARLQQAECNALPERAPKRPRHEKPTTEVNTLRAPLADVSNVTSIETRAKRRRQQPAKPTRKPYKRARSTGKQKNETEYRLRSKTISQSETAPVTDETKNDDSRTTAQTRAAQERDVREIELEEGSEKLSTPSEQAKRTRKSSSMQMKYSSRPEQQELDPIESTSEIKSRAPVSPPAAPESNEQSRENPPSQSKHENDPKPSRRSPSPPPRYPEDEIQPVNPQPKSLRKERWPKRPPRPPSPPPLYPDDEIQPLPTNVKKKPSYGMRTRRNEVTSSQARDPKPQASILASPIPLARSSQSPHLPISSSLLEHEDQIDKPSLLDELSTAEHVTKSSPRIRIVKASADATKDSQLLQKSPSTEQRAQTPRFRSEMEERSIFRSRIGSKAPAPIHTYSKRRQNAQTLALPSGKSLGVRSRNSSGGSPDSKDSGAYDSQSEQLENDEESEDSESEGSEREDPTLVSFIGQQRKLWDEIDQIDLEEDFT